MTTSAATFDDRAFVELADIALRSVRTEDRKFLVEGLQGGGSVEAAGFVKAMLDFDPAKASEGYSSPLSNDDFRRAAEIASGFLDLETIVLTQRGIKNLPKSVAGHTGGKVSLAPDQEVSLFGIAGKIIERLDYDAYRDGRPDASKIKAFDYLLHFLTTRYVNLFFKSEVGPDGLWMSDRKQHYISAVNSSPLLARSAAHLVSEHRGTVARTIQPQVTQRASDAEEHYGSTAAPLFIAGAQLTQLWTPYTEKVVYTRLKVQEGDFSQAVTSVEARSSEMILNDLGRHALQLSAVYTAVQSGQLTLPREESEAIQTAGAEALSMAIQWAHVTRGESPGNFTNLMSQQFKHQYLALEDAPGKAFEAVIRSLGVKNETASLPIITTERRKPSDFDLSELLAEMQLGRDEVQSIAELRSISRLPSSSTRFDVPAYKASTRSFGGTKSMDFAYGTRGMTFGALPLPEESGPRIPGFSAFDEEGQSMHGLGTIYYLLSAAILSARIGNAMFERKGNGKTEILPNGGSADILSFVESSGHESVLEANVRGSYWFVVPAKGDKLVLAQVPTLERPVGVSVFSLREPELATGRESYQTHLGNFGLQLVHPASLRYEVQMR